MKAAYIEQSGPPANIIYGDLPQPERLLAGSGWHSMGSGLDLARGVGGTV